MILPPTACGREESLYTIPPGQRFGAQAARSWGRLRVVARLLLLSGILVSLAVGAARAELLSSSDRQIYRSAFAAAKAGDLASAERQAKQAKDPLLGKVVL